VQRASDAHEHVHAGRAGRHCEREKVADGAGTIAKWALQQIGGSGAVGREYDWRIALWTSEAPGRQMPRPAGRLFLVMADARARRPRLARVAAAAGRLEAHTRSLGGAHPRLRVDPDVAPLNLGLRLLLVLLPHGLLPVR
jgi:hypothetical protein